MIISNNAERQTPQFNVLSEHQCGILLDAAFDILRHTGVLVYNAEARDLLVSAGAHAEGDVVTMPEAIVRDALASVPRSFTLYGRDPARAIHVAQDRVHFGPGLTSTYFIDPETGEKRMTRCGDPGLTARVCDALPNVDYVMGLGLIDDAPDPEWVAVYEFAEMLANTTKPIVAWAFTPENLAVIHRMAAAAAGGERAFRQRPNVALFTTFQPPLKHMNNEVGNILFAAEHGIPVIYSGGPSLGMTAPFTGASAMALYLAGMLSGLAIVQLKQPGAPFVTDWIPQPMDLRTTQPAYGAPEMSQLSAAGSDLCRWLGIPFMGTAGATESKVLDQQTAIESTTQIIMAALSGAAMVHDLGFVDSGNIGSLPLVVMCDEIIGMVKHMLRGIEINEETLMLDLIHQVGPGGHYLAEPRSVAVCRREIWVPSMMERQAYTLWEGQGGRTLADRAWDKLRAIIRTHEVPPLPGEVGTQIGQIIGEMEAQYGIGRAEVTE